MELVAPIVPDAQKNKGPELFLNALHGGLAAFAQMAEMRRRSESDIARLAVEERLAEERHSIERQKLAQAAELIPSQIAANEAETTLRTEQGKAYAEGVGSAAQMKTEATRQKNLLLKEVADNARELRLDDPHFQTKSPMEFAKNVLEFGRTYHLSPLPEIRRAIKAYQSIADSQKLFIKHGVEENGAIKGTGNGRQVPAWRIISNVNNPATREQTLMDLEASGYTELAQGFQEFTDKSGKKVQVPTSTKTLKQPVRGMLEEVQTLPADTAAAPVDVPAVAVPEPTPPDYGPDAETPQYPVGTRGKRGGSWYVLTDEGWKPE